VVLERIERAFPGELLAQLPYISQFARHVESAPHRRARVEFRAFRRERRRVLGQRSGDGRVERAGIARGCRNFFRHDGDVDPSRGEVAAEVVGRCGCNVGANLRGSGANATGKLQPLAARFEIESRLRRQAGEIGVEAECARKRRGESCGKQRREIGEVG